MTPECAEYGCDGILDHCDVNGDYTHPWVERCDTCERYPSDLDAAAAYAVRVGGRLHINPEFYTAPRIGQGWVWVEEEAR